MRIGPPGSDVKTGATIAKTWKYNIGYKGAVPPRLISQRPAVCPIRAPRRRSTMQ
jgi:hypothetical protein